MDASILLLCNCLQFSEGGVGFDHEVDKLYGP